MCLQMTRQKIKGRKKTLVKKDQASGKKNGYGGDASSAVFIIPSSVSSPVVPPIVSSPPLVMAQHECDRGHPVSPLVSSNDLMEDASPRPLAITSDLSIMEWANWYSGTENPIVGNKTEGRDEDRIDKTRLCCREKSSSFEGKRFFFVTDY
jgi:hypothetical protein